MIDGYFHIKLGTYKYRLAVNAADDHYKARLLPLNISNAQVVQSDFYLATAADIVADPSAPNAFVEGIMEGVEWIWDNGLLKAQDVERARNNIRNAPSKQLEEVKLNEFKNLLSKL